MTLSTIEAESCAVLKATKKIVYLRRLLQKLNYCGDMLIKEFEPFENELHLWFKF
jgi:hypothetical protein